MLGWVAAVVSGDLGRIASFGGVGRNYGCPKNDTLRQIDKWTF